MTPCASCSGSGEPWCGGRTGRPDGTTAARGDCRGTPQTGIDTGEIGDVGTEVARTWTALATTAEGLDRRAAATRPPAAEVLTAQALMARDPVLAGTVADHIRLGHPAAQALAPDFTGFRKLLEAAGPHISPNEWPTWPSVACPT